MTYLIAITGSGETADGRYKLVPVEPTEEMKDAVASCMSGWYEDEYEAMLSAASINVAGMAVKVPEHQELTATDWPFKRPYICGWNACLDALGIKP